MSAPGTQQPSCVGHDYVAMDLIPMDLDSAASLLQEAIAEIRKMIANLRSHDSLESDKSRNGPPSKKRKVEKEKLPIGIHDQVKKALSNITYTKDWSGQYSINTLIREHGTEWNRKWGNPNGVMHDLLRVYPECRFEINRDRAKHDTIFSLIGTFRNVCTSFRNEGRNSANRQAAIEAEKSREGKHLAW